MLRGLAGRPSCRAPLCVIDPRQECHSGNASESMFVEESSPRGRSRADCVCVDDDMEVWPACSEFGATDHRDDYVGVVGPGVQGA